MGNPELLVDQTVVHLYFEHKAIMADVRELVLKLRLCEQEASNRRRQFHEEQFRCATEDSVLANSHPLQPDAMPRMDTGKNTRSCYRGLTTLHHHHALLSRLAVGELKWALSLQALEIFSMGLWLLAGWLVLEGWEVGGALSHRKRNRRPTTSGVATARSRGAQRAALRFCRSGFKAWEQGGV